MDSARLFKALGDTGRLLIFRLLLKNELSVHTVAATLGMKQPRISGHLRVLKNCGLVGYRRCGRFVLYSACRGEGPAGRFTDMLNAYFDADEKMRDECG